MKNWGQIKRINAKRRGGGQTPYQRLRRDKRNVYDDHSYASRPAPKGDKAFDAEGDELIANMDEDQQQPPEDNNDEDMEAMGGGSGAAGSGAAMEAMMPIIPQLRHDKVSITYRNRHVMTARNFSSGVWTSIRLFSNYVGSNQSASYNSIITDFNVIPNHCLGWYMNGFEYNDLVNPRFKTFQFLNAKTIITGVKCRPNIQVGGTDLRWASALGYVPDICLPPTNNRMLPFWQLIDVDNCSPAADADSCTLTMDRSKLATKVMSSKKEQARMPGIRLGYVCRQDSAPDAHGMGPSTWPLRDLTIMPATNLKGHVIEFPTWKLRHETMRRSEDYRAVFQNVILNNDTPTEQQDHMTWVNPTSGRFVRGSKGFSHYKTDMRPTIAQGQLPFEVVSQPSLELFPIGPVHNGTMDEILIDTNQRLHHNKGKMPFMFRTEDINMPDDKSEDYTMTFYFDTEMTIMYDLDHAGGIGTFSVDNDYRAYEGFQNHATGAFVHFSDQGQCCIGNEQTLPTPNSQVFDNPELYTLTSFHNTAINGLQSTDRNGTPNGSAGGYIGISRAAATNHVDSFGNYTRDGGYRISSTEVPPEVRITRSMSRKKAAEEAAPTVQ